MPGDRSVVTGSPRETQQLGRELSAKLVAGDVIALTGDLGSGKTCMIQGICRGLGVCDNVNSPTFVLANEYEGVLCGQPITVFHLDLFRLSSRTELEDLGVEEYFYGQGVCLIEWADRAEGLLPLTRRDVQLEYLGDEQRRVTVKHLTPP
jgi:tRNA threonylcarbamoyladenosine biosynthesis protein TsaE